MADYSNYMNVINVTKEVNGTVVTEPYGIEALRLTTNAGDATHPVYFENGIPVQCDGSTGGGGGGSNVTITPLLSSGNKIANYSIDGKSGSLYTSKVENAYRKVTLWTGNIKDINDAGRLLVSFTSYDFLFVHGHPSTAPTENHIEIVDRASLEAGYSANNAVFSCCYLGSVYTKIKFDDGSLQDFKIIEKGVLPGSSEIEGSISLEYVITKIEGVIFGMTESSLEGSGGSALDNLWEGAISDVTGDTYSLLKPLTGYQFLYIHGYANDNINEEHICIASCDALQTAIEGEKGYFTCDLFDALTITLLFTSPSNFQVASVNNIDNLKFVINKIDGITIGLNAPSTVIPNPVDTPTGSLSSIKIDDVTYSIRGGGGGGDYVIAGAIPGSDIGDCATAEGISVLSEGYAGHAEGYHTSVYKQSSGSMVEYYGTHAEGGYTYAQGDGVHAEGIKTSALKIAAHAEGYQTCVTGNYSHAEGSSSKASGDVSHAEGTECWASAVDSHAEGNKTWAQAPHSHAEGYETRAGDPDIDPEYHNDACHAEGIRTTSVGYAAHSEGAYTCSDSYASHSEGYLTYALMHADHAEGSITTAIGGCSHSEGEYTYASTHGHAEGNATSAFSTSHTEGYKTYAGRWYNSEQPTTSSKYASHAEGYATSAYGIGGHSEGYGTYSLSESSHSEGHKTSAMGTGSHTEGYKTCCYFTVLEYQTYPGHAEGSSCIAYPGGHAEGHNCIANPSIQGASFAASHAEGTHTQAIGGASHSEGHMTNASNFASHAGGHNSAPMTNGGSPFNQTGTAFIIGNGISNVGALSESNAFSVEYDGTVSSLSSNHGTSSDYAEYFEWFDNNINEEDRTGYFVTFDTGKKIRIANSNDRYILGIISGEPFVVGNSDCDIWNGMYLKDEFGRKITEPAPLYVTNEETGELEPVLDENNEQVYQGFRFKVNPEYDSSQPYIKRRDRAEWSPVGMLGVLSVYDDGTCVVNDYCKVADNGIATKASNEDTVNIYRVLNRKTENVVEVLFR